MQAYCQEPALAVDFRLIRTQKQVVNNPLAIDRPFYEFTTNEFEFAVQAAGTRERSTWLS